MKALLVGDLHLKEQIILPMVEKIAKESQCDTIILMGDYLDSHGQKQNKLLYAEALQYLVHWKKRLRKEGINIIMLLGNHDAPYLTDTHTQYSVDDETLFKIIQSQLYRLRLQVATTVGDYVISHAGFCGNNKLETWHTRPLAPMDKPRISSLYANVGRARGGNQKYGSPIWADFDELTSYANKHYPRQIVAHTPQYNIDLTNPLIGIDTFSPIGDGSLLLLDDNNHIEIVETEWKSEKIQSDLENLLKLYE